MKGVLLLLFAVLLFVALLPLLVLWVWNSTLCDIVDGFNPMRFQDAIRLTILLVVMAACFRGESK